jgi:hypothetical protein
MPTTQGLPNRSPMIRVSPPAVDHGARDALLLQDLDAAIDRVALGDAAEIDAHARARECTVRLLRIEQHVAPVDARQTPCRWPLVGMHPFLKS